MGLVVTYWQVVLAIFGVALVVGLSVWLAKRGLPRTATPVSAPRRQSGPLSGSSRSVGAPSASLFDVAPTVTPSASPAPRQREHVPPPPAGKATEPWGRQTHVIEVAGESHHSDALKELWKGAPAGEELRMPAVLVPDPANPYGEGHAVAVFMGDKHVGYVSHQESACYFPAVKALTDAGRAVTVPGRIWASDTSWSGFRASVRLNTPAPDDFAYPPSMPTADNAVLLPMSTGSFKVAVTDDALLQPYLGESVAVTLHPITVAKGRVDQRLIEARINDIPVGTFTPATSTKVAPLVGHAESGGRIAVARGKVAGNSLRAELTVFVARASDVNQVWLDSLKPGSL